MIKNKPWHVLNIDISNSINKNFNFDQLLVDNTMPIRMWRFGGEQKYDFFDKDWLEYMKSIDVEISSALLFYREPNYQHPTAHVDLPQAHETELSPALNWCIGPDLGEMVWYELPATQIKEVLLTETSARYADYPIENLTEISRRVIGNQCTLVQVDIPHTVFMDNIPRWLVSARTIKSTADWDATVNRFSPWISDKDTQ